MRQRVTNPVLLLILALAAPFSRAQEVAPDALLKEVTLQAIAVIRQDRDIQTGSPTKLADLVETRIQPLFDFSRMTQSAVGRNWRLATPDQQRALTAQFKSLLVRNYSAALSNCHNHVLEFKRLRAAPRDTDVTVKFVVKQSGLERVTLDYDVEKVAAGWKVYDIKFAGVSLITTYRESFAEKVRDEGVDGLIASLSDKNRQGDSRLKPHQTRLFDTLHLMYMAVQRYGTSPRFARESR